MFNTFWQLYTKKKRKKKKYKEREREREREREKERSSEIAHNELSHCFHAYFFFQAALSFTFTEKLL